MGARKVFDPEKVVLVMDHFVPSRDVESAETVKALREFAPRLLGPASRSSGERDR
jgi:3-isopropylmalate/(R)-2-methylmalate dehydratase large subunit